MALTPDEFAALIEAERTHLPALTNCVFWTAHMLHRHGGYGVMRRGHNGVPFHCLWTPDLVNVASAEPLTLGKHWHWRDAMHGDLLLLFRSQIVIGDGATA